MRIKYWVQKYDVKMTFDIRLTIGFQGTLVMKTKNDTNLYITSIYVKIPLII